MTDTERLDRLAELIEENGNVILRRTVWAEGDVLSLMGTHGFEQVDTEPHQTMADALRALLDCSAPPAPEGTDGTP